MTNEIYLIDRYYSIYDTGGVQIHNYSLIKLMFDQFNIYDKLLGQIPAEKKKIKIFAKSVSEIAIRRLSPYLGNMDTKSKEILRRKFEIFLSDRRQLGSAAQHTKSTNEIASELLLLLPPNSRLDFKSKEDCFTWIFPSAKDKEQWKILIVIHTGLIAIEREICEIKRRCATYHLKFSGAGQKPLQKGAYFTKHQIDVLPNHVLSEDPPPEKQNIDDG